MKKNFTLFYSLLLTIFFLNYSTFAETMKERPYHHLPDGTFRNPEGSPLRDPNTKWSMSKFYKEKKKIKINIPANHIIDKKEVLKNLEKYKNDNYVTWIGHVTFLIKLGNTTIITDPLFSKNVGPLIFGPDRYVDAAIELKDLPETNLFLLTHNHYDHLDYKTIKNFPYKNTKVLVPLKLGKYFTKNKLISGISLRSIAASTYLSVPKIKGPAFLEKNGSVIIVVLPSLIKKVVCPIQAM